MTGLSSTLPHILTIVALWLAVVLTTQMVKIAIFRGMTTVDGDSGQNDIHKKRVRKIVSLINITATVVASSIILLVLLFLSNPHERRVIKTIAPATIDESFREPTKAEIEQSNKEVVERQHREKEEVAERDNKAAMKEAAEIFRKAAEEAERNSPNQ
jgi:hypothetical protein